MLFAPPPQVFLTKALDLHVDILNMRAMKQDTLMLAQVRDAGLAITVASTTQVCRQALIAHKLAPTSTVALGRLLSAAALLGLSQDRPGITSLQIVCQGRLGNLYADVTREGHLRGFVKNPVLDLPQTVKGDVSRRRSVAIGVGPGQLVMSRQPPQGRFTQSMTDLISGEVDLDVEAFLNVSEQISSALACDVLLDDAGQVLAAGGVLVQRLPGGDKGRIAMHRTMFDDGQLVQVLGDGLENIADFLKAMVPDAEAVTEPKELSWQCRCSYEKVVAALSLLSVEELGEMVDKSETPEVQCEFCSAQYEVSQDRLRQVFEIRRSSDSGVV